MTRTIGHFTVDEWLTGHFRAVSVLLLSLLLISACAPRLEGQAEIHYFGFGLETLLPITPDNIVEHSSYGKVEVTDPRFQEVMAVLDGAGSGTFYQGATRARIRDSGSTTIYLDNYGGIRTTFQERSLNAVALKRVAELLESMTSAQPFSSLPLWVEEAAHAHIAETKSWPRTEYSLTRRAPESDAAAKLVIVEVARISARDRVDPRFSAYRRVMAAHSESFELHFDAETNKLVREYRHQ